MKNTPLKTLKPTERNVYPVTAPLLLSLFLTVLTLVGCGHQPDSELQLGENGHYAAPAELSPYVDAFVTAASAHGKTLLVGALEVIYDETLPGAVAGRCEQWANSPRKLIKVKKTIFSTMPEGARESLFFHELGHCFLDRRHDDTKVEREGVLQAASLMSTEIVRAEVYEAHRDEFLVELFK